MNMVRRGDELCGLIDPRFAVLTAAKSKELFRLLLWERDKGMCGICGGAVSLVEMHIDHVEPRSLGGPDHWNNLRAAHPACNMVRGNGGRTRTFPPPLRPAGRSGDGD